MALSPCASAEEGQESGRLPDLASLLERHVEALGGRENIDRIRSTRATGRFYVALEPDRPLSFVQDVAWPDKLRFEVEPAPSVPHVQASDGRVAWWQEGYDTEADRLPLIQAERNLRRTTLQAPLVRAERLGLPMRLLGSETVEGRASWVVEVLYDGGEHARYFLDRRTMLVVRIVDTWRIGDSEVEIVVEPRDYRPVAGVLFPFVVDERNSQGWWRAEMDERLPNVDLPDERFRFPGDR